jgi:hypothetical protein
MQEVNSLPSLCGIAAKAYDDGFIVVNRKIKGKNWPGQLLSARKFSQET